MNHKELQVLLKFKNDLPYFAYHALKIRSKEPGVTGVIPLVFNEGQLYAYNKIEEQKRKTGRVRVICLKGRQIGFSTFVESRYYQRVAFNNGYQAFVLTHNDKSTDDLFNMVKRFQEHCPIEIRPIEDKNNHHVLNFISPDSGYKVGTAGSKGLGRGMTIHLFHGSEVAQWERASEHLDGIMQAVPIGNNTEIILESTARGKGNIFYNLWMDAISGVSDFMPLFIPWFWEKAYRLPLREGFELTEEEREYRNLYQLDNEQIQFRRSKTADSPLKELGFQQEYPSTADEAFIVSGGSCLIPGRLVEMARKCETTASGIKFIGVDPAGGDPETQAINSKRDRTSIIIRQGRVAYGLQSYVNKDTMGTVGVIVGLIKKENPDFVCIDVGGLGAGVVDRLRELGYGNIVKAINFGRKALKEDRYVNKRSEIWALMADWFREEIVSIPNSDSLHADLCAPFYDVDSIGRWRLESKDALKSRGVRSPDEGDALALTFGFPAVKNNANIGNIIKYQPRF